MNKYVFQPEDKDEETIIMRHYPGDYITLIQEGNLVSFDKKQLTELFETLRGIV
ncbi:hypothetical protein PS2_273 [Serratia phage PS2]|uniref:Uncharacterized protein n=1 Tax=Serratia phage PS2 TaxID=1481112 RepID=A0A023W6Q3_9CAUD|nr:hypothetical protein FF83_gp142 [Serratia phage PS2]AHY25511.1 hypothetical protein PS2_273 [Serratia phage PS2]